MVVSRRYILDVFGMRAGLCASCTIVLEAVKIRRAEALGRERVDGRVTRWEVVDGWHKRKL